MRVCGCADAWVGEYDFWILFFSSDKRFFKDAYWDKEDSAVISKIFIDLLNSTNFVILKANN